ncbi:MULTISPECIES: phosphatase PAP2 family protein [unclassified Herbaspirillum]|uniref:phosphatase PAP2 family protein n=1 Tax=unclassified Herbaspirillum TaxID=2624150 RepID=UPI000E2E5B86|nr:MULTISPECIES: phosphatase PAP2 family protein [unclassified Herbaspirillum]RFB73267.1 PAP2 family protein [Herbaspirillum sp. 3R-3a1]TFI10924.1 phosphatase PAP2 family protein [Herbaspirillum sp. 3R11]TFI16832.1 phosphatase PAP2 family protein [Herbaspirillum sp. 3R-11]TFI26415.1 phosphatase PAP2 family protein [Herbaspirillum sp. 3C11]TFI26416.1 phosphatase PAP2 family protein [Herbaspirillum sp. 3C11]
MTQQTRPASFLRARLARDHHLGLPLTTGILAVLSACSLFALVAAHALSPGALVDLDQHIADWLHAHATAGLTQAVLAYTHLHGTVGILAMSAVLAFFLWRQRPRASAWLLTLAVTVPGGMLFNYWLKFQFQRVRPHFEQPILVLDSFSFPSGHTIGATLFYCVLAAWLASLPGNHGRRPLIIVIAITLTILAALSRLYLGAHFFSDVLAAMLEGLAWFALWATIIFTVQRHQLARKSSN